MGIQTEQGKAFEYACLIAVKGALQHAQTVEIEQTAALIVASAFYNQADEPLKEKLNKAAQAAARLIFRLEPQLQNPNGNEPLYLSIQEDKQGQAGDVRDILCIRKQNGWEIGFSCKHNHTAVKHSRLSETLDFGCVWLRKTCSDAYFAEIKPIFEGLKSLKNQGAKWADIPQKDEKIYLPILQAFVKELKRLDAANPNTVPAALLQYLLGKNDFYKIIAIDADKKTQIQAYNLFGTLNQPSAGVKAETKVPQLKLPSKIYDVYFKENSTNTIIVACDAGWQLSFRIHNASSKVEPSLKFDIQLIGVPQSLHSQIEAWY